jgi:hypothetical protein
MKPNGGFIIHNGTLAITQKIFSSVPVSCTVMLVLGIRHYFTLPFLPDHPMPAKLRLPERILNLLTAIKCWSALLLYRVYCVGQAVNWKFKWKVKMFRNSL